MKDIYLKFSSPGLAGESRDDAHQGWIEILAWNQNIVQPRSISASTAGGHTSERTEHDPMLFMKELDAASPTLYQHCSGGTTFDEVIIDFMRADNNGQRVKYQELRLKKVMIALMMSSSQHGLPVEVMALAYASIQWTYTKQNIGGGVAGVTMGAWSLSKNAPTYTA